MKISKARQIFEDKSIPIKERYSLWNTELKNTIEDIEKHDPKMASSARKLFGMKNENK